MSDWLWWRDGVIYQIYPRSFQDANGDGVGDLDGIRQRLDHLAWLGVDAIWLSPCFPSPMADFGYDVADYCDIDPLFGTLADFDRLLADAHARGIKVVLDLVPNHTSDQHALVRRVAREPRATRSATGTSGATRQPDGVAAEQLASDLRRPRLGARRRRPGQYYLHSFLKEQPDLNWRNPALVEAMHDVLRFWLDRGVDGFRIDVIHRIAKDAALRDNPILEGASGYGGQRHDPRREPPRRPRVAARLPPHPRRVSRAHDGRRGLPLRSRRGGAVLRRRRRAAPRLQLLASCAHPGTPRPSGARSSASSAPCPPTAGPTTCSRTTTSRATRAATTTPARRRPRAARRA